MSPKDPKGGQLFDIIYEYGTFSAIHPGRRDEYFEVWYKMLKDDEVIISLFYPLVNGNTFQGPPHCTSEGELMARLGGIFDVIEKIPAQNEKHQIELKEELQFTKNHLNR